MRKKWRLLSASLFLMLFVFVSCARPASLPAGETTDGAKLQTGTPTVTPTNEATATPSIAAKISPTIKPNAVGVANAYSAYDGQHVYYVTDSGMRRMGIDGSDDETVISNQVYEIVGISDTKLYYLIYDDTYLPKGKENEQQYCNAFELRSLDLSTGESASIKTHISECTQAMEGLLYLIDHDDHYHVWTYNIQDGSIADVSGVTPDVGDEMQLGLMSIEGKPYLISYRGQTSYKYPIQNGKLGAAESYAYVYEGTVNEDLGLEHLESVITSGDKTYALTMVSGPQNNQGRVNADLTLYEVSADKKLTKVYEGSSVISMDEGGTVLEVAGPWAFFFWTDGDGGTVSNVIFKEKIG